MKTVRLLLTLIIFLPLFIQSQTTPLRLPATPLVTSNPYFSIWNFSDHPDADCYDTKTGKMTGFQARSVVGGVFIKMLEP